MASRTWDIPEVPGLLRAAAGRARPRRRSPRVQQPDGGIPWAVGEHIDVWNHVEGAMALLVGGEVEAAEAAYDWCAAQPARRRLLADEDHRRPGRGRQRRDQHVRLPRGRRLAPLAAAPRPGVRTPVLAGRPSGPRLRRRHAAAVRRHRLVAAGRRQGQRGRRCSPAARASTTRCGPGSRSPSWWGSRSRTGSWWPAGCATRSRSTATCSWTRPTFSMDWYYPVLGGPLRGEAARGSLDSRWDDFVVAGLGLPLRRPPTRG